MDRRRTFYLPDTVPRRRVHRSRSCHLVSVQNQRTAWKELLSARYEAFRTVDTVDVFWRSSFQAALAKSHLPISNQNAMITNSVLTFDLTADRIPGLSPPSQAPWEQKPPPHWVDHKPPQMAPQTNHAPPQPTHAPQMGGYVPQYWYQPETNPSLLT